jgi:hypothetical protein
MGFSLTTPICQGEAEFPLTKRMFILYLAESNFYCLQILMINKGRNLRFSLEMPLFSFPENFRSPAIRNFSNKHEAVNFIILNQLPIKFDACMKNVMNYHFRMG